MDEVAKQSQAKFPGSHGVGNFIFGFSPSYILYKCISYMDSNIYNNQFLFHILLVQLMKILGKDYTDVEGFFFLL